MDQAAGGTVQIDVQGPDSKAVKSNYAAFHTFKNGRTTLSCSGLLLFGPSSGSQQWQLLAPVTCLYPFIQQSCRSRLASVSGDNLLPGVTISVIVRPTERLVSLPARLQQVIQLPDVQDAAEQLLKSANTAGGERWKLGWNLADQQPPDSATAAMVAHLALLTVNADAAMSLGVIQQKVQHIRLRPAAAVSPAQKAYSVGQQTGQQQQQHAVNVQPQAQPTNNLLLLRQGQQQQQQSVGCGCANGLAPGMAVSVIGSPFGCLAADQFHGAVITGIVSSVMQPVTAAPAEVAARQQPSLFVVDARCMPGMEGGPIVCKHCGRLLGILAVPLSSSSHQVELMLGISISSVAKQLEGSNSSSSTANNSSNNGKVLVQPAILQSPIVQPPARLLTRQPAAAVVPYSQVISNDSSGNAALACSSNSSNGVCAVYALQAALQGVVLVRVGRSWGTGIVMTHTGLVLTVAHVFKAAATSSSGRGNSSNNFGQAPANISVRISRPSSSSSSSSSNAGTAWVPAQLLYRFQGYLDLAVLQLQLHQQGSRCSRKPFLDPTSLQRLQLCEPLFSVAAGDEVYVVGHGLFGPGAAWPPAVTAGVVARLLSIPHCSGNNSSNAASRGGISLNLDSTAGLQQQQQLRTAMKPSMLITTAAVHGGASGGALFDTTGQLVGLVTSNAKHVRGATLPHWNFCISCEELRPVWEWAQQQQWQSQLQQVDKPLAVAPAGSTDTFCGSSGSSGSINQSSNSYRDAGISSGNRVQHISVDALQHLKALDLQDDAGQRLWSLLPPLHKWLKSNSGSAPSTNSTAAMAPNSILECIVQEMPLTNSKL